MAAYYADLPSPVAVDRDSVFIVAGTSEAYSYLFKLLCDAGDEVLIAAPGYPLLEVLARICDVNLIHYHLFYDHGWHIDFHDVERRITARTRAIALVHPNNPTGSYIKPNERERLAHICRKHSLALIADEVFLDYAVERPVEASFAGGCGPLSFTLSGLSKVAGLPQMKAAWMVVKGEPDRVAEASHRLEIIADTFLSASTPVQEALGVLLGTRHALQRQIKERLRVNLAELDAQLGNAHACSRLMVEGGWYVVLRVPAHENDEALALRLLAEESVIVEPGHFFDFPADGYLVLSLLTPVETFRVGVRRILARF